MSEKKLILFAQNHKLIGNEKSVYQWDDPACGSSEAILVKKIDRGNLIGAVVLEELCWGMTYYYYEMSKNNIESIKLLYQISSGRSAHFSNWAPSSFSKERPTKAEIQAVAKALR